MTEISGLPRHAAAWKVALRRLRPTPLVLFVFSLCVAAFLYGYSSHRFQLFPDSQIRSTEQSLRELAAEASDEQRWYYVSTQQSVHVSPFDAKRVQPGLTRVDMVLADKKLGVKIIDLDGNVVHKWSIDWFDIWPEADHMPEFLRPKSAPGTIIHGAVILGGGDLIFNFENLGLVRMDPCGKVVWKLPYPTHHSVHLDESGILWVSGQIFHNLPVDRLPNHVPPFREFTILKVDISGEILSETSIFDILQSNDLNGLMYLSTISDETIVGGDTMHLNDVETFPASWPAGVFSPGDILVSLRNINTVLVFQPEDLKVKYLSTSRFVRQHDPDFVDGNHISIYDNNNTSDQQTDQKSRILIESALTNMTEVYYEGNDSNDFYSSLMGKHQWLDNGNLLITESRKGRVFEVDQQGSVVWEYVNLVGKNTAGIISEGHRLPGRFTLQEVAGWGLACAAH